MPTWCYWLLLLPLACCRSRCTSTYAYGQVSVTRVDEPGHSYLYWGKTPTKTPCVSIAYHGFDAGVAGFLVFKADSSVAVIGMMGSYTATDSTGRLTVKYMPNEQFIPWRDSLRAGQLPNVSWLLDQPAQEQQANQASKSAVQVTRCK